MLSRRPMVCWCLGCSGLRVDDILEGQKGDQGGGPTMAKTQYGVIPDIF